MHIISTLENISSSEEIILALIENKNYKKLEEYLDTIISQKIMPIIKKKVNMNFEIFFILFKKLCIQENNALSRDYLQNIDIYYNNLLFNKDIIDYLINTPIFNFYIYLLFDRKNVKNSMNLLKYSLEKTDNYILIQQHYVGLHSFVNHNIIKLRILSNILRKNEELNSKLVFKFMNENMLYCYKLNIHTYKLIPFGFHESDKIIKCKINKLSKYIVEF